MVVYQSFKRSIPGTFRMAKLFKKQFPNFCNKLEMLGVDVDDVCLVFDKENISKVAFERIKASGIHFVCSIPFVQARKKNTRI
ncbi:MAG: hypothetical protein ACTSXH_01220 [Promethearchaeota archaeon]